MSFESGSATFRRYRTLGPRAAARPATLCKRIAECAFGKYASPAPDELQLGWVTPRHLLDADIVEHSVLVGRFLSLVLRQDRLSPPPYLLRSYVRQEEDAALAASGRDYLTRQERTLARESAQKRALAEAREGAFRRIAAWPLLYDLESGTVYFSTLGTTAHDQLVRIFADTFDLQLEPITVASVAHTAAAAAGVAPAFEDARPAHLIPPPDVGAEEADAFALRDGSWLGRELLTWLWFRSESESEFDLGGGRRAAVVVERAMQLDCDFKLTGRTSIAAASPGAAPEALAALCVGKQPTRTGLIVADVSAGDEYALTLDAARYALSGLRLPEPTEKEPHARREERYNHFATAARLIDDLVASWTRTRFAAQWIADLESLRRWATGRPARLTDPQRVSA